MIEILSRTIVVLALVCVPLQCFLLGAGGSHVGRTELRELVPILRRYCLAAYVLLPAAVLAVAGVVRLPWEPGMALLLLSVAPPMSLATRRAMQQPETAGLAFLWQFLSVALCIVTIPALMAIGGLVIRHPLRNAELSLTVTVMWKLLLPLVVGVVAGRYARGFMERVTPALTLAGKAIGRILIVLVFLLGAIPTWRSGIKVAVCTVVVSAAAIGIGHWFGAPPRGGRAILTSALALHRAAPVIVLAHSNSFVAPVMGVFLIYLVTGMVLLRLYGRWMRSRGSGRGRMPEKTNAPAAERLPGRS